MMTVYHNLGLGDHFVFCGLVHAIQEREQQHVRVLCKWHNLETVMALYAGYDVSVAPVADDTEARGVCAGCEHVNLVRTSPRPASRASYDADVYAAAGLQHIERWQRFGFQALGIMTKIPEQLLPNGKGDYVFLHDDHERGFNIEWRHVPSMTVIYPEKTVTKNVLDYFLLILNATEIHVIDSCFRILADQLFCSDLIRFRKLKDAPRLVYHRYARPVDGTGWHVPSVMHPKWEVIEKP